MATRRKEIKKIEQQSARLVTFSKRRKGLFKKASELSRLAGAQIAVLAFSPAGRPFVHGTPSFEAVVDRFLAEMGIGTDPVDGGAAAEGDRRRENDREVDAEMIVKTEC